MRELVVSLLFGALVLMPVGARAQAHHQDAADRQAREQAYRLKLSDLSAEVPSGIASGLDLLLYDHYEDAEKQLYRGSRIPENGSLASAFRGNREHDGQYQGFDVVSIQNITPRLRVIYLALEYQMAPYFLKFTVYNTTDGWVILHSSWVGEDIFETVPMIPAQSTPTQ
ncbi:MAG TPA: hypothetical protein VG267_22440 [Terracidiphilus sp.]|jgi:hypothetical protein|nr:hypothetical protein [Terracidiphilus sp.]